MLRYAYHHAEELQRAFTQYTKEDEIFMFFFPYRFFQLRIEPDTSKKLQFVSVDQSGQVVGMFIMRVDWHAHHVYDFAFINFQAQKATFSLDLARLIKKLFEEFKFRKIKYKVIVGHDIEATHDRLAMKYGKIVGTFREDIRLTNGQLYDVKHYELSIDDYRNYHK
ncbi:hypothetical protein [Marinoscillum luteum]|mgnify:CR=1 FL=1|uniref:N-acetyltransferase domain-containing protein n=1 Tax=Marinoscillum luteum TaxID=861051 RepID=A0ABW7N7L6_9BACT